MPSAAARRAILALHAAGLPLAPDVNLDTLAAAAVGYSGADLAALCREAAMRALAGAAAAGGLLVAGPADPASTTDALTLDRSTASTPAAVGGLLPASDGRVSTPVKTLNLSEGMEGASAPVLASGGLVRGADFQAALARVRPSITRGWEADIAPARWEDIGGLADVKRRLRQAVEWPLQHAAAFERLGLSAPRGVLLHGPPGCCKTTLARAAAGASRARLQVLMQSSHRSPQGKRCPARCCMGCMVAARNIADICLCARAPRAAAGVDPTLLHPFWHNKCNR